jgi:pyruvate carboxylase subunit B
MATKKTKKAAPKKVSSKKARTAGSRTPAARPGSSGQPTLPELHVKPAPGKKLLLTEVALRDGHQCLLATRMRTEDMLPIAQKLDSVGFWSLEVWGGATFDTCLRFLKEDPWERLRALRQAMPNTKLQMLLRGQNLVGYRHYADDVLDKFIERSAANGIDVFRIFDALNDVRNLERAIREVKACEKHVEAAISYTTSPVHHLDGFVKMGKRLEDLGADTICIKDMAGLLAPMDAYLLVKKLKAAVHVPIHLHSHYTSGMGTMSALMAVLGGVDMLDTSVSPRWQAAPRTHPPKPSSPACVDTPLRHADWTSGNASRLRNISATSAANIDSLKATLPAWTPKSSPRRSPAACCRTWLRNWPNKMPWIA